MIAIATCLIACSIDQLINLTYQKSDATYNEKSFGIWNILLEKDLSKDFTVYAGIDNVFNHQDDDRAYQEWLYRFGINMKLSDLGESLFGDNKPVFKKDKDGNPIITNVCGASWFLSRPSDNAQKAGTVDVYGDYRLRSNMFKGKNKVDMRETKLTQADDGAAKNYADKSGHGLEQRLRLGVNYQIADDLNLDVVGSTSRHDTSYNVADKRGLHDVYLEKAELNKNANQWDWTVGRIHEPMGVTSYWFGKEYDGARVMYTNDKTQVVVGYGDFSQTTGVSDSAYSHKEHMTIYRGPTLDELLGLITANNNANNTPGRPYGNVSYDANAQADYVEKFNHAGENETDPVKKAEAKLAVIKEVLGILDKVEATVTADDSTGFNHWRNLLTKGSTAYPNLYAADITVVLNDGSTLNLADGKRTYTDGTTSTLQSGEPLKEFVTTQMDLGRNITNVAKYGSVEGLLDSSNIKTMMSDILGLVNDKDGYGITGYLDHNGNAITKEEAVNQMFVSFVGDESVYGITGNTFGGSNAKYNGVSKLLNSLAKSSYKPVGGTPIPLPGAPITFAETGGYLLKQDKIPTMDRAAFIKVRHQIGDNIGLEAWKLNSFGEGAHISRNDVGINEDMRIADTNAPGSWNAYFDYKALDHGSFLGGTGADLPDRYLDGIRSFTAGFGYVPARNLLEASYTFDAHSTQKRDTACRPSMCHTTTS